MKRRWNISIWVGFAIAVVALVSYVPVFVPYPSTRDLPWPDFLLFLVALVFLVVGLDRAFRKPNVYRGKISGSILAGLTVLMIALFCVFIFYATKQVPASPDALRAGQPAAQFTLSNADGKQVSLADLLKNNRAALLIFYRGYW